MYVCKYSVDIYLLCMIKIRVRWCTCSLLSVITLSKFIGLLLLFCPPLPLYFVFEISKNTRNEPARPVIGTIFLVILNTQKHQIVTALTASV